MHNRYALSIFAIAAAAPASLGGPGVTLTSIPTAFTFDRNNTFGWRFMPTRDIDVTEIAYFDVTSLPGGTGAGLAQQHEVGIFRVSDHALLASVVVPAGTSASLDANFRYTPLPAAVHLAANTVYLIGAFYPSASPDAAAAADNWVFPPEVVYANSPAPTPSAPLSGTSLYFVSASGNPPSSLSYPPFGETGILPTFIANFRYTFCYANCDGSTSPPILNVNDFACFLNRFAAGDSAANCDGSTVPPTLNVNDFACFLNAFATGCP